MFSSMPKSSLKQVLFGQAKILDKKRGIFHPSYRIGSILDNILLDREFDQERLDWALKYSALEDDLKVMKEKLDTKVNIKEVQNALSMC